MAEGTAALLGFVIGIALLTLGAFCGGTCVGWFLIRKLSQLRIGTKDTEKADQDFPPKEV